MNNIDTSDHIMSLFSYVDKKAWKLVLSKYLNISIFQSWVRNQQDNQDGLQTEI
jgi:hypothetical protein